MNTANKLFIGERPAGGKLLIIEIDNPTQAQAVLAQQLADRITENVNLKMQMEKLKRSKYDFANQN